MLPFDSWVQGHSMKWYKHVRFKEVAGLMSHYTICPSPSTKKKKMMHFPLINHFIYDCTANMYEVIIYYFIEWSPWLPFCIFVYYCIVVAWLTRKQSWYLPIFVLGMYDIATYTDRKITHEAGSAIFLPGATHGHLY